jgi:prophage antirepressor-like protein
LQDALPAMASDTCVDVFCDPASRFFFCHKQRKKQKVKLQTTQRRKKMNKDLFDATAGAEMVQPESAIMFFNFNGNEVRVSKDQNGEPWFVAKDVADILGYRTANDMTRRLDDEEKGYAKTRTLGGVQETVIINESGLYNCVFGSSKEEAKAFRRWVTSEVIPSIRKHGAYMTPETIKQALLNPDTLIDLAYRLKSSMETVERQKMQLAENERQLLLQKPDVEYTKQVLAADNLHTANTIAVHLGISAIKLNKFLMDEGIIYKQGDLYYPSAKIRNKGLCDYHIIPYINSQGETMTREHLKWTEAGRRFVIELYNKRVHGAA